MAPDEKPVERRAEEAVPFDAALTCESCGRFGARRIGDHALCDECIVGRGSCCPEFGQDDLWAQHET